MKPIKYMSLILITTFLMGIAYPLGKIGMSYAPPFLLMGIRYVLAGGLLALLVIGRPLPRGGKQWGQVALIGLFQSAGVMGCVYYSMHWITSSESVIISSSSPLIVILLGTLFSGVVYRFRQWMGVVIGCIGVAIAFGLHLRIEPGTWFSLAGAVFFAVAAFLVGKWGGGFDKLVLAAYQMLIGGVVLLILSSLTEPVSFMVNSTSITVMLLLALLCSIVQFSIWFYLLTNTDPAKTSSFLFLVPIFGVLCSWLLLGEHIAWYVYAGGVLVCVGIYLVNKQVQPAAFRKASGRPA
ncbi:EamA family transporter [Paenibacillus filicis]|uniref:EamA family transporter n=1 Tax=Paenibacillus filicis TaxID=669464 RepID=A0ABU9DUH9_9BACL